MCMIALFMEDTVNMLHSTTEFALRKDDFMIRLEVRALQPQLEAPEPRIGSVLQYST